MSRMRAKNSNRLLAAFLALVMVFSVIPFSTVAHAATSEYPDSFTVTVTDGENPIEGATVELSTADTTWELYKSGTTDANGIAAFSSEEIETALNEASATEGNITVVVTKTGYNSSSEVVSVDADTLTQNVDVKLTEDTTIKDVTIEGKTLTYDGSEQELVSVTEVAGDTITYVVDGGEPSNVKPTATDVCNHEIKVTVSRDGKDDLVKTVTAKIEPADITGISIEAKNIAYNEKAQELVTLTGSFAETDVVTWTVNSEDSESKDIPKATAVGTYTVVLTVDRGSNYNKLVTTAVTTNLIEGELNLEGLKVTGLESVYTVEDGQPVAQPAVTVENKGDYNLKYQVDDGDLTVDDSAWVDEIPTVTNAGSYIIWVKAVKESYKDSDVTVTPAESAVAPYNVYVAKADQTFSFKNYEGKSSEESIEGTVPYGKKYDFSAVDTEALAGGTISYAIELDEEGIASIDAATGELTVDYPGAITVKATLSGNENYNECVIEYTLEVSGEVANQGQYISFANAQTEYVLGTSDEISDLVATKNNKRIQGSITYELDKTPGVRINKNTGVVTVTDYDELASAIRENADGSLEITVTATKAKSGRYGKDTASYTISISFGETPTVAYSLPTVDGTNNWYKTAEGVVVTAADGYSIAKNASGTFGSTVTFNEQGTDMRYVYLKNTTTGAITDKIAVVDANGDSIKFDNVKPEASKMKIEFSELNLIQKVGQMLGFYKPDITITFTAEDATSGIDHFDWTYTKSDDASDVNVDSVTKEIAVTEKDGVATAILTLSADVAEQYRGKISFTATDKANNESVSKAEDYVFVVDEIAPTMSITYAGAEPYVNAVQSIDKTHYFDGSVEVKLTVTEANFYSEDVEVSVSKDGATAAKVNPDWNDTDVNIHVGTFTLSGDGDYVVYVTYLDKAKNEMTPYESETITIDETNPEVKIDFVHEGEIQKTVFTVKEHNFRNSDVVVTGTMKDINGNDVAYTVEELTTLLQGVEWTETETDTYTYETDQYVNGIYDLAIDYTDISGNKAEQYKLDTFIIDHSAPSNVEIEIITSPLETFLNVATLGFYNPDVTVKFTAYDDAAGVESFTWNYTKENGASDINRPTDVETTTVKAEQDTSDKSKFTATVTLPDTEAKQLRGYLAVYATDTYKNNSEKITDDKNVIVVDTIAPEVSVEYSKASRTVGDKAYYNGNVEVTITVDEANFYASDVEVKTTKNNGTATAVTPEWSVDQNNGDIHYGKFTLTDDGHYVVSVKYEDKSDNFDENKSAYTSHEITIDTVKPVIDVDYQNEKVINTLKDSESKDRQYYDDTQTAVVTITEHNFDAAEVDFTILAKDVTGATLAVDALHTKSEWSVDSTGDVHKITITYPGDANYTFDVAYTDLATNEADDYATDYFSVDKTVPENLSVDYSTSVLDTVLESLTFGFYNAKMTVTITAEDPTSGVHSFLYSYLKAAGVSSVNAELIEQTISADSITYSADGKTATAKFEIPKMVLNNDNQFNGTVEFTATDRSGNESDAHKETKRIVVDNIAPTASVTYNEATNVVGDISYYNGNVNATVTINEANFYASDVQVMVSKDGGNATAVTPTWTNNSVDVHVGTFTLSGDGDYFITINYKDKSSNIMATYTSKQLTIDTDIKPATYTINGVAKNENGGAYKGDATIAFNYEDENFDTKTIKLTRTRFDSVEDVTEKFIKASDTDKGGSGSFTIPSEVENDGIYVLTVGMTDKAKHTTESQIKFTINRYGSVYEYDSYLVDLIKDGGQYVTSVEDDLVITEYNADRILEGSLNILITRDGEPVDVDYTSNPENINASVGIGSSGWYQYVYTIKASNFEEDGVYKISLTSAYAADDSENNDSTSVPENSIDEQGNQILDAMNFTVDSVAPEIRNIVNLDKAIVDKDKIIDGELTVKYTVVDVGGLKSIEIILNGESYETVTDFGDSVFNYSGEFKIKESDDFKAQTVQIIVTDLAGNVTDTAAEDFSTGELYIFNDEITVSRNFFVRWYANTALFWGSIAGVVVLVGGIWFVIAAKRKKKEDENK